MNWKKFAGGYLNFSRRDRIGVFALLTLIIGVYFLPDFIKSKRFASNPVDTATINSLARLEIAEKEPTARETGYEKSYGGFSDHYEKGTNHSSQNVKGELFYFDPNTISPADWKRLGLRDKTIGTIQNYLIKGGKFRKPEDLKKVYGLFPNEYERLEPYIRVGNGQSAIDNRQNEQIDLTRKENPIVKKNLAIPDINSADTNQLIALPGIGSKLALRIINFRKKLGGFYSIEQVGETFGLADSTFQKIKQYLKLGTTSVKKINLNTATLEELKAHPYIRYAITGPIISYRNEHGAFKKIEDLKNVMAVTEEVYKKILPYLIIE